MATLFRPPLITPKRGRVRALSQFLGPNLVLPIPVPPRRQDAWPLPARHPWRDRTWTQNLLQSALEGFTHTTPFAQLDWPVSLRRRREALTWSPDLLGTTLIPTVAAPFSLIDWPNPRRAARRDVTWSQNLVLSTLASPFIQSDWPLGRQRLPRDVTWSQDLLQSTLEGFTHTTPFVPIDWPLPRTRREHLYDVQLNLLATTLATIGAAPFAQYDWPSTSMIRSIEVLVPVSQNLLGTTLSPPVVGTTGQYIPTYRRRRR